MLQMLSTTCNVSRMGIVEAKTSLRQRAEDVFREIGVLLLVFTPIDFVVALDSHRQQIWLLILFALGAFFLTMSLVAEFWRLRVRPD